MKCRHLRVGVRDRWLKMSIREETVRQEPRNYAADQGKKAFRDSVAVKCRPRKREQHWRSGLLGHPPASARANQKCKGWTWGRNARNPLFHSIPTGGNRTREYFLRCVQSARVPSSRS